jgi:DMSO/TMAO reductase YedYZ molybdopterin-dependent catalytic subunit
LVAVGAALAVGQLVAGLLEGTTSAVVSVGEVVVEHAPYWLKEFAIRTFGEDDKPALIAGTTVVLVVLSVALGAASVKRLWVGVAGTVALGLVGALSATTRTGAGATAVLPSLLGATAGVGVLVLLVAAPAPSPAAPPAAPSGFDRRRFLLSAAVVAGGAVAVGGVGKALQRRFDVAGARSAVQLPPPASPAAPLPAGADLGVAGITPFTTPNGAFYRVDTALVLPQVAPDDWSLRIAGMVEHPIELRFEDLLDRELVERDITLVCVSNEVGGQYAGTARWLGVPLRSLLDEAGVQPGADQLVSRSVDGWTAGTPTRLATDGRDAMVAVGMNGEPLPVAHGFPARLVVPGLYGYTSATKWLTELELTTFAAYDPYWVQRGWAEVAPIKTMARIDTPRGLARLDPGPVAVGGVAWAIHRGIDAVEVRVDDGPWQRARLGEVPDADTWRQWVLPWDATSGRHTITARAVDGTGAVQTEQRAEPIPDGASGWHSIVVMVR